VVARLGERPVLQRCLPQGQDNFRRAMSVSTWYQVLCCFSSMVACIANSVISLYVNDRDGLFPAGFFFQFFIFFFKI
jgi:hypothetical protein